MHSNVCILQLYIDSLMTLKCILVRAGDRLGIYSEKQESPIAYVFDEPLSTLFPTVDREF